MCYPITIEVTIERNGNAAKERRRGGGRQGTVDLKVAVYFTETHNCHCYCPHLVILFQYFGFNEA